jgi:hypothetical protein
MSYPDYNGFGDADPTASDTVETPAAAPAPSTSDAERKPRRKAPRPAPTKLTAAQVRRVLTQAESIQSHSDQTRELLAAALGTTTDLEELVVGSLAPGKAGDNVAGLLELREATGFAAVVSAGSLLEDKDSARRVWALLTAVGQVAGPIPAKDLVAATNVAEAGLNLDERDVEQLIVVRDILGA